MNDTVPVTSASAAADDSTMSTSDGAPRMYNNRTVTDYAFMRHLSPSRGVTSEQQFADAFKNADLFGYVVRATETQDPQGHPQRIYLFFRTFNPAAEADKVLILDTSAPTPERLAAFKRHNERAAGVHVDILRWEVVHCFVLEYYTRLDCFTHNASAPYPRYAAAYASILDPIGGTETETKPYCGECLHHLRQSADGASMEIRESAPLRIGQHD